MSIIELILNSISPHLRKALVDFVLHMSEEAAKTPNPWDDILCAILRTLLAIKE